MFDSCMVLALAAVLLLGNVCCQEGSDEEQIALIDEFIRDLMESERMVGAAHAVVKFGRPLMAQGYGVKDLETQEPVTNHTLFYLASCTKAINAALVVNTLDQYGYVAVWQQIKDVCMVWL